MPDPIVPPPAQVPPIAVPPVVPPVTPPAGSPPVVPPVTPPVVDAPKPPVVPPPPVDIKYELKLPEGSLLDPKTVETVTEFAKANKLTPEAAQGLLDRENKAVVSYAEQQQNAVKAIKTGWIEANKKDPEFGGEKLKESAELAKRVLTKYASPEFLKALDETGFGDHPELVRAFFRIGKAMREDQLVTVGENSVEKPSLAQVFYGAKTQ